MSAPSPHSSMPTPVLGLGLDAGGTQTRWALSDGTDITAEGSVPGISGTMLSSERGREELVRALLSLSGAVLAAGHPARVEAGITGLPDSDLQGIAQMKAVLAQSLAVTPEAVSCRSDIHIAWRAAFSKPAEGYLLYAGTGSIAAFVDEDGALHRAGGRGMVLGDEGSGFWIGAQALAHVWRLEDEAPGSAAATSPMARRLFEAIGDDSWPATRNMVYGGNRGAVGKLALAVAASAEDDPAAAALLHRAGVELARLPLALAKRFGHRPVVATGRAWLLSPLIEKGLRETLGEGIQLDLQQLQPQRAAALAAARMTPNP